MKTSGYIVLSHGTARQFWKAAGCATVPIPGAVSSARFENAVTHERLVSFARSIAENYLRTSSIDVLAKEKASWWDAKDAAIHVYSGKLPPRSLRQLADKVLIASPELSFLEMAATATPPQLVLYGMELCSSYCINPETREVEMLESPLTTVGMLREYALDAKPMRGTRSALNALQWVHPGAESPMEIKLVALLRLPKRVGGYAFPPPQLNRIVRPGRAADAMSQSCYRPDVSWPEKMVALEYDGKEAHEDSHKDKRRINDLEALGWKVFSVTAYDLKSAEEFHKLALKLGKGLGHRVRLPSDWKAANENLRYELGIDWRQLGPSN